MEALYNLHWLVADSPWQSAGIYVDSRLNLNVEPLMSGNAELIESETASSPSNHSAVGAPRTKWDVVFVFVPEEAACRSALRVRLLQTLKARIRQGGNLIVIRVAHRTRRLLRSPYPIEKTLESSGVAVVGHYYIEASPLKARDIVPADSVMLKAWDKFRTESRVSRFLRLLLISLRASHLLFGSVVTVGRV
jgi:hypothetical protein